MEDTPGNERRKRLKNEYGELFDQTSAILFRHDPIGINFEENADEYDPEVGTILPRLGACASAIEVRHVVFEEFCKWFDLENDGDETSYGAIAEELWALWLASKLTRG
jgi:hypothetical protein